jgi:2-C-methyl-D-erythritol 2,4-cyclodiphosphate synthase
MTSEIAPPESRLRVGVGYDAHRLERGLPLTLGGIAIAHDRGPLAHSDGDVIAHAIGDALLGACGLGDLGEHFPDREAAWRGASSLMLLERIRRLLEARGDRIVNIDATLIAEAPRIRPHVSEMRAALGAALGMEPDRVSVKATTNEGLGAFGREEGIAAHAVALVERGGP